MAASIRNASLFAAVLAALPLAGISQTQPAAVPVPFVSGAVGVGNASSTVCANSIASTDGSSFGDGCPGPQAKVSAPQGAAVDGYGNVYFADYNDKQVRVLYEGGAQLAAAITAANSGYAISSSRRAPAPTPVAGNVYTIAGVGASGTTFTALGTGYPCANYSANGQPTGLNSLGDGCPAASAPVAARDVKPDADGNLFIADYSNGRIRVFCVNCAAGTLAQKLITVENPTVTAPVNGAMYTVAGFANGYRDGYMGYNTASNASGATAAQAIALLRDPTGVAVTASDDVFIADNLNNALRVLYNGGAVAKAILQAEGTYASPVVGYVYTVAGAGCVSAATNKTGSVSSANSCLTTTGSDTPAAANTVGTGPVWSVYLDGNSNVFYSDGTNNRVKVIYGGVANPLTIAGTLHAGYTYSFAGQGTGIAGAQNGVPPSQVVLSSAQSVGGDAYGNIFFADYGTGYFYEVSSLTGNAVIFGGDAAAATTAAAGAACNGVAAGPAMTDAFYNGCPATQVKFSSPRGPIVADAYGDLFFGDAIGYFVREFSYGQMFPATTVGTSAAAQPYAFTFVAPLTLASRVITPASDFSDGGNSTCNAGAYAQDATCVQYVAFTPSQPSERNGSVELTTASGVAGSIDIGGLGRGSQLLTWPGTVTTAATGYTASGVAVDASGAVYFADTATNKVYKVSSGTASALASGFTKPAGVAVDGAGNVFVADATANTITEVPVVGGTAFVLSKAVSAPGQVATGADGTLYVADTGNNRILAFAPNSATPRVLGFTGLSSPKAVAVDGAGDVYTASGSSLLGLAPNGTQSSRAGVAGVAWLAVDASGTLYASTGGSSVIAFGVDGTSPVVYTGTAVAGVALDGAGGLYVADTGVNGVAKSQGTAGYYKFPTVSGSTPIVVTSSGTQPVASTAFTSTNTTDYNVVASTSNGCSGALPSGYTCGYTANYAQVTLGAPTDTLSFAGGTTFTLASISLTPAITISALPANVVYGGSVTLSATVYGPNNTGGTVTFYANGAKLTTVTSDANGLASYTYKPAVGTYTMSADYTPTGASSASVATTTSAAVTVTAATAGLSLQLSPTTGYTTTSFTATATLTSSAGTPTGTVTFFSGTTQVGTGTVNTQGVASATFTGLSVGSDCITAQYGGDANFNKITTACTNITVAAGFSITPSSTSLSFQPNYQEAQTYLNIVTGGRTDTLTFACTGLPAKLQCAFSPATVTLAGNSSTVQVQMLVANSAATYGAVKGVGLALTALPLLGAGLLVLRRRRVPALLVLALAAMVASAGLSGCGGQDPKTLDQASGTYNFNVTVSSGSSTVQTIPFTLTIP